MPATSFLSGGQLTDEAAALLGMSPAERESADNAFGELLNQFRRAEIQRMEPIAPPAGWSGRSLRLGPRSRPGFRLRA